jgi:DNA polymerase
MDPQRRLRVLRQFVQTDRLLGIDAVPLGDRRAAPIADTAPAAPGVPMPAARVEDEPAHSLVESAAAPGPARRLDRETKLRVLAAMDRDEVVACRGCGLCDSRSRTVFGEGDPDAKLMFIGEGPGQTEDEQGRPFVGRAGELLDKMIAAMGLQREEVYIANVVKCRPPGNRAPLPNEVEACWGFLKRQIAAIEPRVIVTLGGPATKLILGTSKGITSIRGQWDTFRGLAPEGPYIAVMPTFHPSYVLRNYSPDTRKKVWADLKRVMAFLESGAEKPG